MVRNAQQIAPDLRDGLCRIEPEVGQSVKHRIECACHFHRGKVLADAHMLAAGKRHGARSFVAEYIEAIRIIIFA
nr:hypothetical protein [Novosphingobium taihuense]